MSLFLHHGPSTEALAGGLADLLTVPGDDPFARDLVVVPAKGVERWLAQRLSHHLGVGARGGDGVCAGIRFLNPHSLVALLLGTDRDDPWHPDRMVWPLLDTIDEHLDEPWAATLAAHLGARHTGEDADLRRGRRFSVARRLAGLFDSYAVQRPSLLSDWRAGRDTDGVGGPLDADLAWQAELWRRLIDRVDDPPPDVRHEATLEMLRETSTAPGADALDLPDRLSLFGHTRLGRTEVELLAALGSVRDVHVWLPQPSPALWATLTGPGGPASEGPVPRADDSSALMVDHRLLVALGRDSRELTRTLALAGDAVHTEVTTTAESAPTVLGWLHHDVRTNNQPSAETRAGRTLDREDDSVQIHACHGPIRQVDVLREVLVGMLEADPTLEPRDILVMCPDIETYAPLIQAGFGLGEAAPAQAHPAHRLRVLLADRSLRSTNPLLAVAAEVIRLAGGRVNATEMLDLLAHPPVQRRFALSPDDLDRIRGWIDRAGIRWGLDASHRERYQVRHVEQNTWRFGVDRVLAGAAMTGDDRSWVGTALPLDEVDDLDLAGRFAELVDRVRRAISATTDARSVQDWVAALNHAVAGLTEVSPADAWQSAQFEQELASTLESAGAGQVPLQLADVRVLLEHRLSGRPTRANFRTGTLTVCTMVPMRSVPHRVVCLIGLDDGAFPRTSAVDGDDALARRPLTGERDARSEDRQLLLDAIMAAGEKLVITYTGADPHTGTERPPAVPLGELIDALDATVPWPDTDSSPPQAAPQHRWVRRHPLQPFDARNFGGDNLGADDETATQRPPFSFDTASLAGAEAARRPRTPPAGLLGEPLPRRDSTEITVADLQHFFTSPARHFLRRRLDVSLPLRAERTADSIPITLDALQRWGVGDRLLQGILSGLSPDQAIESERLRGLVPPGALFGGAMREICDGVQGLLGASSGLLAEPGRAVDVDVDLGDGRRLTGTVPGVHGDAVVSLTYSTLKGKQRLASWIDLLALTLGAAGTWSSRAVGRGHRGAVQVVSSAALDHSARTWLLDLVDVYDRGLTEPLPLPSQTGFKYAEAWSSAAGPTDPKLGWAAGSVWKSNRDDIPGERDAPEHVRVYGAEAPLEVLLGKPRSGERWNDAVTRLGQYAVRVWAPILAHQRTALQ